MKSKLSRLRTTPALHRRPLTIAASERPLTLAEQRARARWHKPVAAIVADALASNRGLLERLKRGMHGPHMEHKEQYQVIFDGLYQTTREQIGALEVFARVNWSE
jgi:hypothetical protein